VPTGKTAEPSTGTPWPPAGHGGHPRDILCGPIFEDLPTNHQEKAVILHNPEETSMLFYKMVEDILTLKEIEERARQAAEAAMTDESLRTGKRERWAPAGSRRGDN